MITKAEVRLVRSLKEKKVRDELGLFVAEGDKCIEELKKGFEMVLYCDATNATPTEIEQMSAMRTPQGSIAVFKKGEADAQSLLGRYAAPVAEKGDLRAHHALSQPFGLGHQRGGEGEIVLALDGVQDPGNMGTIIRTADWFGVREIVCSKDTADCYNPKVVQATMGALARVRIHYMDVAKWLEGEKTKGLEIFGTLLEGRDMYEVMGERRQATGDSPIHRFTDSPIHRFTDSPIHRFTDSPIIVMGNEGKGISPEVRKLITCPIRIPSYPKDAETSESLNVAIATAVVLAEFRRPK